MINGTSMSRESGGKEDIKLVWDCSIQSDQEIRFIRRRPDLVIVDIAILGDGKRAKLKKSMRIQQERLIIKYGKRINSRARATISTGTTLLFVFHTVPTSLA